MAYHRPATLKEAVACLEVNAPQIIAGGTDWYPAQGTSPIRCDLLDVSAIHGLSAITHTAQGWRFGAMATWSDVVAYDLPPLFDGLKTAARQVGSIQIQNSGTLAGNICNASPAADGVPALLTLNAQVEICGPHGTRTVPLDRFLIGVRRTDLAASEMVTAILVPEAESGATSAFIKLGARSYLVISIVMVCAIVKVEAGRIVWARIAVGACSAVAERLPLMEDALKGTAVRDIAQVITDDQLNSLSPIDDVRGSGAYRREAARELCLRAVREACHV